MRAKRVRRSLMQVSRCTSPAAPSTCSPLSITDTSTKGSARFSRRSPSTCRPASSRHSSPETQKLQPDPPAAAQPAAGTAARRLNSLSHRPPTCHPASNRVARRLSSCSLRHTNCHPASNRHNSQETQQLHRFSTCRPVTTTLQVCTKEEESILVRCWAGCQVCSTQPSAQALLSLQYPAICPGVAQFAVPSYLPRRYLQP